MRPSPLWIAVLALALAVFGLWRFVAGGPAAQALAAGASGARDELGALPAELARSEAAAERDPRHATSAAREVAGEVELAGPSPAAAAAAERRDVVTGRVLDGQGEPVAGAAVHACVRQRFVRLPLDIEPDGLAPSWYAVVGATTDADGRYELEPLAGDELALAVRAPGFAPARREGVRVRERDGRRELDDTLLAPGAVCAGRVVDPRGQGIAGVRVVQAVDGRGGTGGVVLRGRGIPLGESAADGSFRIDELAPGPFALSFDGAGFRVAEREGKAALEVPLTGWIVELDYGAAIAGRVDASEAGGPFPAERLATLRVSARAAREPGAQGASGAAQSDGPTGDARARHGAFDGEGAFAIDGLVPGAPYRLTVWEPRLDEGGAFVSWSRLDAFQPTSARGGDRGVLLEHRPQSALVFRVLDDATGEPLEAFGVWVGVGRKQRLLDDRRKPLEQHPGGRVVCSDLRLRPGGAAVSLAVVAPGRAGLVRDDLRVAPGETLDLGDVRLARAPELVVTVLAEESGEPLAGARVGISYMSERELGQANVKAWLASGDGLTHFSPNVLLARTDAAGRASIGARAGQSGLLFAAAEGRLVCDPLRVAMPDAGDLAQELRLRRGGTVVVHVRDDAGDPVEGVAVVHRAPDAAAQNGNRSPGGQERSDAAGELRFAALEPGVHGFRLSAQQSKSSFLYDDEDEQQDAGPGWTEVVVAGSGEVTVDLVAPPRGALAGTVRESGVALEGASLQLVLRKAGRDELHDLMSVGGVDDPLTSASDPTGAFRFEDVAAGVYDLFVAHPSRRMPHKLEVEVRKGLARVDVELSLTQVEGRVVDVDGRPLEGIAISISSADLPRSYTPLQMVVAEDERGSLQMRYDQRASRHERSDAQGRYTLRGVAAGTPLTVVASGEMVVLQQVGPFELAEGELRRGVDFRLEPAGTIALELRGEPSSSAQQNWFRVELRRAPDEDAERAQASSSMLSTWQRKRVVGSLRPGRWTVELKGGVRADEVLQTVEVEVGAGGRHEVVFRL